MQENGELVELATTMTSLDFRAFFAEEHASLFKALYFVTGDRADAADLAQDAFLKMWERWDRVQEIRDPVAYLFQIALNGSRMRSRAARRAALRPLPFVAVRDPFDDVDVREEVRHMLRTLAPRQRAALILLDLYDYGSEDAARIMGIRPATVRTLAAQARAALRDAGSPP